MPVFNRFNEWVSGTRAARRFGTAVTGLRRALPLTPPLRGTGCPLWPFLTALLLCGIVFDIGLWTVAAAAAVSVVFLIHRSVQARPQGELVGEVVELRQHDRPVSLSPHLRWELEQVMARVRPADLSVVEIAALLAVLVPAHSRVIGGPADRPELMSVGVRDHHAAPNFA